MQAELGGSHEVTSIFDSDLELLGINNFMLWKERNMKGAFQFQELVYEVYKSVQLATN